MADSRRSALTQYVEAQFGKPYVYGATGPDSFDCSGLVWAAFRSIGVSIPRTSESQWSAAKHISRNQLQPGDIVFTTGSGDPIPGHEGLYVGGDQIVEAPHTGDVVKEVPFSYFVGNDPWDKLVGYGSFFPKDTPPASTSPGPTPAPSPSPGNPPAGAETCYDKDFVQPDPTSCYYIPGGSAGIGTGTPVTQYPGTMKNGKCCVPAGTPGQNVQNAPGTGGDCQCAHVSVPLLGGFNLLPCFFCDVLDALSSTAFWVRVGEIVLGLILLAIGLFLAGRKFAAPVARAASAARSAGA